MHVNRVLPPARVVLENPLLDRVALNSETRVVTRGKLAVDGPLTVIPFEPESACHHRCSVCAREVVEVDCLAGRNARRVNTVVGYNWTIDHNLQDLVALAGTKHIAGWATSVLLLEAVLDVERLALKTCEVNDHIHALSDRDARTIRYLHRLLQKVSVDTDLPDRFTGIISRVE